MRFLLVLLCAVALPSAGARALELQGAARVIDGDTLEIAGEVVRLHGIDAPEGAQRCGTIACGAEASRALGRLVRGAVVTCRGETRDAYGRLIAVCEAGGTEINEGLVAAGLARAFLRYSDAYAVAEASARAAGRGFWRAGFPAPWEFRANAWRAAAEAAPFRDCPIKGNISANGRIYHTPHSRWYEHTRIDTRRGERWFCTEAEALEAGWRPARG